MNKNVVYSTEISEEIKRAFQLYHSTYGGEPMVRRVLFLAFASKCDKYFRNPVETALQLLK